jgi:hypothetical protein
MTSLYFASIEPVARDVLWQKRPRRSANRPSKRRDSRNGKYNFIAAGYNQGTHDPERPQRAPAANLSSIAAKLFS